jgi:hypothetical protein
MLEDGGKVIAKGTARLHTALQLTSRAASLPVASTALSVLAGRSFEPSWDTSLPPPLDFTQTNLVRAFLQGRRAKFKALTNGWQPSHLFFIGLKVASELRDR